MTTRIPESHTRECRRKHHLAARLYILRIIVCPHHIRCHHLDGSRRPHIAYRVRPLVRRAQTWILRRITLGKRQRRVRLQPVAQHIEAAASHHLARERPRVKRIDNAHHRPQRPVRDPSLCFQLQQVENRNPCRLASRPRCRGNRNKRLQWSWHRTSLADGCVHISEEVSGIGHIQVRSLCSIYARAAANGHESVECTFGSERNRLLERHIRRLYAHPVEQHRVDCLVPQGFQRNRHGFAACHPRVSDHHNASRAESAHLVPDLARNTRPELDARSIYRICGFKAAAAHHHWPSLCF